MELVGTLVCYTLELMNIFLLVYILKIMISNSNIYPFNKADPYTESLFILCILIHQTIYFIYSHNIYLDDITNENICRIISSFFDHFLCFIPLIIKMKYVTELFQYSYQHLSYDYSDSIFAKEKVQTNEIINNNNNKKEKNISLYEEFYKRRAKNPNPDFKRSLFIFIFIIVFISGLIYIIYYIPQSKCFLFYSLFGLNSSINDMQCTNIDKYINILLPSLIIKNIVYYSLLCYTVNLLFNLWRYEINKDILFIRLEITINCLWVICHNFIFHSYLLFTKRPTTFDTLIFNFLIDFSFTLIHLFFVRIKEKQKIKDSKRKQEDLLDSDELLDNNNRKNPEHIIMMNDFEKFMKNIICFLAFKKYVKSNPDLSDINLYLDFYVDYYLYKIHLKKDELVKKTDLIIHAYYLYNKYFKKDDNNTILDLPLEIIEDIEEKSKDEFCFTRKQLYVVYDNAFKIIYNKLYNIYALLMKDKKASDELQKILEFSELDEIKEDIKDI